MPFILSSIQHCRVLLCHVFIMFYANKQKKNLGVPGCWVIMVTLLYVADLMVQEA